jgi:hypothetical protein
LILGDLLRELSEAGLRFMATEGESVLRVSPASNLTPDLAATIKENKEALICVALEDQRFRQTGVIQSERQVREMAREHFGLNGKVGAT